MGYRSSGVYPRVVYSVSVAQLDMRQKHDWRRVRRLFLQIGVGMAFRFGEYLECQVAILSKSTYHWRRPQFTQALTLLKSRNHVC
jgi:hypothetical protein